MSYGSEIDDRIKTDMRLTPFVAQAAEEMSRAFGVPKNAVISIAIVHLWLAFGALAPKGRARIDLLNGLEEQIRNLFSAAKRAA